MTVSSLFRLGLLCTAHDSQVLLIGGVNWEQMTKCSRFLVLRIGVGGGGGVSGECLQSVPDSSSKVFNVTL